MAKKDEPLQLRVGEAKQRDVGKKRARIGPDAMHFLKANPDDIIEITGKRSGCAVAWPKDEDDKFPDMVRVDRTILATLTVIAAVPPMAFVRGLMGPYMRPMPVGASLAIIFSLAVALVAAPWFSYRLLRGGQRAAAEGEGWVLEETRTWKLFRRLLVPLLSRPSRAWGFLVGVTLLLVASVALLPLKVVTVKMLPFDNKSEVQVLLDMPEGTTLEQTARVAREIGLYLQDVPEVTDLQIYAGAAAPVNFNGLVRHYDLRAASNAADIQVNLLHKSERDTQSHDFAKRIRPPIEALVRAHGGRVKIAEIPPGPPVLSTLVAEIYGPDDAARQALAEQVLDIFDSRCSSFAGQ